MPAVEALLAAGGLDEVDMDMYSGHPLYESDDDDDDSELDRPLKYLGDGRGRSHSGSGGGGGRYGDGGGGYGDDHSEGGEHSSDNEGQEAKAASDPIAACGSRFVRACRWGGVRGVQRLLVEGRMQGLDYPNARGRRQWAGLHAAASEDHIEVVRVSPTLSSHA